MAAPRNGDAPAAPKRSQSSRRSYSSSPASSPPPPSLSPSPRTKRLRRAQEERDLGRGRSRDGGMTRDRDRSRDRDRDRDRNREREKDIDRVRSRDRDHGRDRKPSREEERPRDRRGRDRELERSRDRSRERRGGGRERAVETSPPGRSPPVRSRRDRSFSPMDVQPRRRRSPSRSPPRHRTGSKHDQRTSTGPSGAARDEDGDDAVRERTRGEGSPTEDVSVARMKEVESVLEKKETNKEQPSFEYSGKLAAETNKVKGVTLQFTEPPEARKPTTRWRLYVFKDSEPLNDPLYIHRQTCYLFGRERRVADIPTDHPSCSKQHAVIQYRLFEMLESLGKMCQLDVRKDGF